MTLSGHTMIVLPTPRGSKASSPVQTPQWRPAPDYAKPRTVSTAQSHTEPRTDALPYQNSIATVCFEGTVWEKIDATAAAGFDLIEIMATDLDEASPEQIVAYCDAHHLDVSILQPFRDLEGYTDAAVFSRKLAEFEAFVGQCTTLRTNVVLLCANCDEDSVADPAVVVPQLQAAAAVAAKYGVNVAYENLSWAAHYGKLEDLVAIVEQVDRANFGVCMDLFHINIHGSLLLCLRRLDHKVFFAQYCDLPALTNIDILSHARNYRVFPYQGAYGNVLELLKLLADLHYAGPLLLEVFNRAYREKPGQCPQTAHDALNSLVYMQAVYCDTYLGTSMLPPVGLTDILVPFTSCDWADVEVTFDLDQSVAAFHARAARFQQPVLPKKIAVGAKCSLGVAFVNVPSRLMYNLYVMVLRAVFGLEPIAKHGLNVVNHFGLPMQSVFGNDLGVRVILSIC